MPFAGVSSRTNNPCDQETQIPSRCEHQRGSCPSKRLFPNQGSCHIQEKDESSLGKKLCGKEGEGGKRAFWQQAEGEAVDIRLKVKGGEETEFASQNGKTKPTRRNRRTIYIAKVIRVLCLQGPWTSPSKREPDELTVH